MGSIQAMSSDPVLSRASTIMSSQVFPASQRATLLIAALFSACLLMSGTAMATAMQPARQAKTHRKAVAVAAVGLDTDDARFLLARTGFQPDENEVRPFIGLSREQAVDRLLAGTLTQAVTPPPDWVSEPAASREERNKYTPDEVRERQRLRAKRYEELRAWWVREMIVTPSPLTERMTLFWHNHFTSGQDKVRRPQLMYQQNVLLRHDALGNFGDMLHAVAKDPAMLIYLDGANSRKGRPNENFAREVMELFTLGEGHYSEADIKEAARAYTGWSIDPDTLAYMWRPQLHDTGEKTVLGQTGDFDGDQVLDILLSRPETATLISAKLWREFISPTVDDTELTPIADAFRASHYDIKLVLRRLFLSKGFWALDNRAALVKSPAEFVVGTVRQFNFSYDSTQPLANAMRSLGQNLFYPPNVKGWPGGSSWIDSSTLLARKQLTEQWMRASEGARTQAAMVAVAASAANSLPARAAMEETKRRAASVRAGIRFDLDAWLAQFELQPQQQPSLSRELQMQKAVLPMTPFDPVEDGVTSEAYLQALLMDPTYQLK